MRTTLLAMALAVAIVAVAGAAPVTLEFSGVISAGKPADVGKSFTGYVTYEVDNIESVYIQPSGPGTVAGFGLSLSGCQQYINEVCTSDQGTGTPVVTDYRVEWEGPTFTPWDYSLEFNDQSQRLNLFDVPPGQINETWSVSRNQNRNDVVGDVNGASTRVQLLRQFVLSVSSRNNALVPGPVDDFEQQFFTDKATGLFFGGSNIVVRSQRTVETCSAPNACMVAQDPVNYEFGGYITVARFRTPVMPISIDIRPTGRSTVNVLNLAKDRGLDVAIKGSAVFDVSQVDPGTVTFGPGEAAPVGYLHRDYDSDGFVDAVFSFTLSETGIACGDTSAMLTARTYGPQVATVQGADGFATKGCP
jgi:hypothetical protein